MGKVRRGEKRCFKCGDPLPLSQFYKHPQMADGRLNKCKECTRLEAVKNYRDKPIEQRRAYEVSRGQTENRRAWRAEYQRRYRADNREKVLARQRLLYAVRTGKIQKGLCEFEGSDCDGPIQGHHEDYSKPLEVRWLCQHHHREVEGRLI